LAKVTRRNIPGGAAATVAGVAAGPVVRPTHASPHPVKIGVVLPYTGVYAVLGESNHPGQWSCSSRARTGRWRAARSR